MLTVRRAGAAVLTAVLIAGAAFLLAAVAKAGDATHQAAAPPATPVPTKTAAEEGKLEAEYTASIAGIPIGRGNWLVQISDDQYTAAASGTTTGIIRFFTGAPGTGAAHSTLRG